MGRRINEAFEQSVQKIREELYLLSYVCTTADIWSAKRRSFLGVTCHWIDDHLQRHSAVLACRRFSGTHSFSRIAEILEHIHVQFNLNPKKIVSTITDNGSNFVKAFKEYGVNVKVHTTHMSNDEPSEDSGSDSNSEEEIDDFFLPSFIDENDETNEKDFALPKHIRCASHTLNLIATTDFSNAINSNTVLRSRHEKIMQKCNKLWSKAGRPKSAEVIQDVLGHTLSYPCITRWNSFFKSVSQILDGKNKLKDLFDKLDLNKDVFKDSEIQYLEEYCKILKPIANTLDFLQVENNTYFGYVLPSILSLKVNLSKLQTEKEIKLLSAVLEKLCSSLARRFECFFSLNLNSEEAIIAALTLPTIKLRWLPVLRESNPTIDNRDIQKLFINKAKQIISNQELCNNVITESKYENVTDFFDFNEAMASTSASTSWTQSTGSLTDIQLTEANQHNFLKNKIELELLKYPSDTR